MYFRKSPYLSNFDFLQRYSARAQNRIERSRFEFDITTYRGSLFRIRVKHPQWKKNYSQAGLKLPPRVRPSSALDATLDVDAGFGLSLKGPDRQVLLSSPSRMTFGVSGQQSMFVFHQDPAQQFYGMGEKMRGLELSGVHTKFWNTDIFGDFHWKEIEQDRPDPMYASIPYLIIKRGNQYVGLLLDNPYATFMSISAPVEIGGGQMIQSNLKKKYITLGAEHGMPDLYILVGPTLAELTRKFQQLVGCTPLPPVWALGYQQCRWGYQSEACLKRLDAQFRKHGIPCDGLWLDIDYMDAFKVFTFRKDHFPHLKKCLSQLERRGRKVVPIIDPGVKREAGYSVYESGRQAGVFCQNPQKKDFIGLVWPGETVFPDFSIKEGRTWWARKVRDFARNGIYGAWLDMNDPSTGKVRCLDMRFNKGKESHYTYHNQYALGMAQASRQGFVSAHPTKRPFLVSRSGFTGISKYAALWTGDNMANYHYLRNSIAVSLNLALSGVPFNGPDIGGFAGDTWPQLISDWMKACFLFPFCRNHCMIGNRDQEPWAFDEKTLQVLKHYIQLRYKLRPYLYNLFIQQESHGEAILRPLFYDFPDSDERPLGRIDDQFMVGPALMQAPILSDEHRQRTVVLPGSNPWYSTLQGTWVDAGPDPLPVAPQDHQTALFIRDASIIPMTPGALPSQNKWDGHRVEFHVFMRPRSNATSTYDYRCDDGESLEYQQGKRSHVRVTATAEPDGTLAIKTEALLTGYGRIQSSLVVYGDFTSVTINGKPSLRTPYPWTMAGKEQQPHRYRVRPAGGGWGGASVQIPRREDAGTDPVAVA